MPPSPLFRIQKNKHTHTHIKHSYPYSMEPTSHNPPTNGTRPAITTKENYYSLFYSISTKWNLNQAENEKSFQNKIMQGNHKSTNLFKNNILQNEMLRKGIAEKLNIFAFVNKYLPFFIVTIFITICMR